MRLFANPRMRGLWLVALLLGLGLFALVGQVEASDGMRGDRCVVAEDEYIVEDFYFSAGSWKCAAIDGDLLGIGSEIHLPNRDHHRRRMGGRRAPADRGHRRRRHPLRRVTVLISERARITGDARTWSPSR